VTVYGPASGHRQAKADGDTRGRHAVRAVIRNVDTREEVPRGGTVTSRPGADHKPVAPGEAGRQPRAEVTVGVQRAAGNGHDLHHAMLKAMSVALLHIRNGVEAQRVGA